MGNGKRGYWELIMVAALLLIFGLTALSTVKAGSGILERIEGNKSSQSAVRAALSYINVRLRQSDAGKSISVCKIDSTGENGILIKSYAADGDYDTWIYFANGKLLECVVGSGEPPGEYFSKAIAELPNFSVELDEESNVVTSTFSYDYDNKPQKLISHYKIRNNNF